MFYDYTYIVYVMPALIFAMWAQFRVNATFKKYSQTHTRRGVRGSDAAEAVLRQNDVYGVKIERVAGHLTDHYNPKTNTISLSESVYDSTSTASVGVAAHEAGHAVQYAKDYLPVRMRMNILPLANIGSKLSIPLVMIGLLIDIWASTSDIGYYIAIGGVCLFSLAVAFQLVTLPVEFNASKRAMAALGNGVIDEDELPGAKKTLWAAAMTYVAALAVSVMQLVRLLTIVGRRRDD